MSAHIAITNPGPGDITSIDTVTKRLGRLEVQDAKLDDDTESYSSFDSSDESQSDSDSIGATSPEYRELPRPCSPISKGGSFEIDWELAIIMLHQRSFFFYFNDGNQVFDMYCWGTAYVPTPTGGVDPESQFWRVSAIPTGFRFQLSHRIPHSTFANGTAFAMGHQLVLSSQSTPRALYKFPELMLVTLCDDIMASYQELRAMNGLSFPLPMMEQNTSLTPIVAPVTSSNPCINPMLLTQPSLQHGRTSPQLDYHHNQGFISSGSVGVEEASTVSEQRYQVPATSEPSTPVEANNIVHEEVEMGMNVENTTPTEADVKAFATAFRKEGPGKGAQVIICLHCPLDSERRRITTNLRPSNLTRHLLIDFGIKSFRCNKCNPPRMFTFKDQLKKHVAVSHRVESSQRSRAT
ncbi:unnamed protein product [Rhizoctonia solani]|uniref:C2H2-type domain-containing protein n=1 Tax=Rhizoctonia solani TaxID=456999 RepID=A0A8H3AC51_9AGAM|nr:unnamed protein product [Rhizoctonia solani]